jgi:hypothetical protein
VIDYETFCRLRQLHDQEGLKVSQIAEALHLDPKTVEKWIDQPKYQPRAQAPRPSKLDGFKGHVAALLEPGIRVTSHKSTIGARVSREPARWGHGPNAVRLA